MKYRCPYCKEIIETLRERKCPHCGRYMSVRGPEVDSESAKALSEKQRARRRAIERIHRRYEREKKQMRGGFSPSIFRSPTFYFGVMAVLALIGALLFSATDKTVVKKKKSPYQVAMRHIDILAEALGRYRFHVGRFPTKEQGLAALVRDPGEPKWNGPYVNQLIYDPWNTPFVYEPRRGRLPILLSLGADKQRGTNDDVLADPECFDPGTAWTNGWVSAEKRVPGVIILDAAPDVE